MNYMFLVFVALGCLTKVTLSNEFEVDPNGYITWCPCMGRFGNQADQFLGALQFSKDLGRTLIVPYWIEYPDRAYGSDQIPFQAYFKPEALREFTKIILMEDFMKHLADKVWPKEKRIAFCYGPRNTNTCSAKEGNPFGPYWDKFKIDFEKDEFYGPLGYDLSFGDDKVKWSRKYPSKDYPVLAFTGAPGAFPVSPKNTHLQKYLKWSDPIENEANQFIKKFKTSDEDKFIGLHIRNGVDFKNACVHSKGATQNFFASVQCLGEAMEHGDMTEELCYPSEKTIMKQLGKALQKTGAKIVYVAADGDHMISRFENKFKDVKFYKYNLNRPHIDLNILGKADHAIVNCVSTFSAFVKRQRDVENKTTEFWAFKPKNKAIKHTEEF